MAAKKKSKKTTKSPKSQEKVKTQKDSKEAQLPNLENMPKETADKIRGIKEKIEKFQKSVLEKFEKYVMGIAVLPPPKEPKKEEKDKVHLLILIDDNDSQKMSKAELKEKIDKIVQTIASETDKTLLPNTILFSELLSSCYDGRYDIPHLISLAGPVYDKGMLAAMKITEIHKNMIIKKFEKYIVSYVLAGSLVQGKATETSDIDVWIVIDDTDVKKMTRAELKDKLRAIIIGMGYEAGSMTGIQNKLNIQVYILSEFWDSLKEANPVIFTLLRDGVPLYDRGMFMPWKHLLKMGKIKPSTEAIDLFMQSGDQMLQRVQHKIKEIGMEDTFWAILTPSQAALMLYGVPPPTPRETPKLMKEIFVDKEKLMEEKYVKILERNIKIRKDLEHGTRKSLSGKEVDQLLKDAENFLERIKKLFEEIENIKQEHDMINVYETTVTIIRDVLKMEGKERVLDAEIVKTFEDEMISTGKIPAKFLRILNEIIKGKKDYEKKKLSKTEVESVKKSARELHKFLIEYMQRKRGKEFDRAKVKVKHNDKYGEVILLGKEVFIIHNVDAEQKEISRASIDEEGAIGEVQDSNYEEFEKAIANAEIPSRIFLKEKTFEDIKRIFGKEVEILVNY